MSNLTLKQKIILGIVIGCMAIVIGIYGYISLNQEDMEIVSIENINNEISEDINNANNEAGESGMRRR